MTHKMQKTAMILAMALMTATPVWAVTDYSSMNNEELSKMRGTMPGASQEERNAFSSEWQERTQSMTTEERQQYAGQPANATGDSSGKQQGMGQKRGGGGRQR